MTLFKRMFKDQKGATAIEYGLIAALIAVAAISIYSSFEEPKPVEETPPMEQTLGD